MNSRQPQAGNERQENLHCPFVSIIIPVFNDDKRLRICLEALENQTYPKTCYEIIVVDNGSDKAANIQNVVTQFSQAIATYEGFPSSYAARNKGISLAKGEVIAFTDADCIPASNWIENGVRHLLEIPNCGLVAGKIELFFRNPHQLTAVELYESIMNPFPQQIFLEEDNFGATANVFTYKSTIDKVGDFDATLKSSGDREWGQRVYAFGYQQIYAEDTCVAHPARSSFKQLYQKTIRLAGGHYILQQRKANSFFKHHTLFVASIIQDLKPPLRFALKNFFLNSSLKSSEQKIIVYLLYIYVRHIIFIEKIRLGLGGIAAR